MTNWEKVDIEGKIIKAVEITDDEVVFTTTDDNKYKMNHYQDCCEYVRISHNDDIDALIGSKIKSYSEEVDVYEDSCDDSGTITLFNFNTDKGVWSIKWIGESNGYYSESVDFNKIE